MAINVAVLIALLFVPAARAGAATATSATGAAHVANDSDAGSVAADLLDAPTQFHIAAAGRTSVRVGWMTMNESASVCVYGPATGAEPTLQADGTAREYLRGAGWHHVVLLTNLTAGGRYVYTCGDGAGAMGDAVYFTAPPSATTDVSLAIWGDLGYLNSTVRPGIIPVEGLELNWTSTFTWELLNRLTSDGAVDAAWWLGDIGYSDDASFWEQYVFSFEYENVTNGYCSWMEGVSRATPLMVTVGNHESACHSEFCLAHANYSEALRNFSAYNTRWHMPSPESNGTLNMWYSWDIGGAHIVSINTETDFPGASGFDDFGLLPDGGFAPEGAYLRWLEADLKAAAATGAWIIVGGHKMFDSFNSSGLARLFNKYGVALYLGGHGHSYARYNGSAWNTSNPHIMVGGAGCDSMAFPDDQFADPASLSAAVLADPAAACDSWCTDPTVRALSRHEGDAEPCRYCAAGPVYVSDKMSIGTLAVSSNSLTWKLLRAPDGAVLDSLTITR